MNLRAHLKLANKARLRGKQQWRRSSLSDAVTAGGGALEGFGELWLALAPYFLKDLLRSFKYL